MICYYIIGLSFLCWKCKAGMAGSFNRDLQSEPLGQQINGRHIQNLNSKVDNVLDLLRHGGVQCRGYTNDDIGRLEEFVQKSLDEIRLDVKNLKDDLLDFAVDLLLVKDKVEELSHERKILPETTYTRWGRNTCPGNGSDSIYSGFAGGSWYGHTGGAASMLCLPPDPDWEGGKYNDQQDKMSGYIFGAEYQDAFGRSDNLFGTNHLDKDVPCVVCNVKRRSSAIMIPGKTKCNTGWTFEYSGYLMSGRWDHLSASDYYCIDKNPDDLMGGGHKNEDGLPLYFVEARCGSLKCPPYVDGREMRCVVCTK